MTLIHLFFLAVLLTTTSLTTGCPDSKTDMAFGTLERDRIELASNSTEQITAILVREGDLVSSGQILLKQDDKPAMARLDALIAAQSQAAAKLAELEIGTRKETIAEARSMLKRSQSLLKEAQQEFWRVSSLFKKNLVSQSSLDQASTRYEAATAAASADQSRLDSLVHGFTHEQIEQARFALTQAQAQVSIQRLLNDKLTITAPRDGIIDSILYEVGEQAPVGATVIVLLSSDAPYAKVYIPEPYRSNVVPGLKMQVYIDGVTQAQTGSVRFVSSDPAFTPYYALSERDRSRLSYLAEIDLSGPQVNQLPVGLPLQVELPNGSVTAK